ncbi:cytochrome P450 [Geopyxis carbonaria]|nr:cytochrome P450 [Geopyxis carbonaria]
MPTADGSLVMTIMQNTAIACCCALLGDADAVNEIPIWQYVNDFEKPKLIEDKISRGGQFSDSDISPGCTKTYRDALEYFNRNIFQILLTMKIFPRWMLDRAPRFIFQYAEGHDNLESYLRQLVESERSKPRVNADKGLQAKDDRANNILSLLVRQEELAKTQEDAAKGKLETTAPSASLSDAEILGNVYIFALAGHETTAITLIYALTMLALYPEKQAWLHASLDSILATQSSYPRVWTYEELYPQLTAPLCVMVGPSFLIPGPQYPLLTDLQFETLRHFPPAPTIPKWTGGSSQTLTIAGRTYHLPPYFPISINVAALHMNPKYYGPDVNSWDPVRWDPTNKSSFLYDPKKSSNPLPVNSPPINKYPKGAFMPWSDGYRGCLGKKFSQVEFVTTITVLCSRWKIGIKNECGETQDDARERVLGILARSNINNVGSLGMKEPFDFTFEKRV